MFTKKLGRDIIINKKNLYLPEYGTKNLRNVGKTLNLKLDYGGSAYTVKDELACSEKEAQEFINLLEKAFPKKAAYFNLCKTNAIERGYILTNNITNRRIYIDNFDTIKKALVFFRDREKEFWERYKYEEEFKNRVKELNFFSVKSQIERNAMNYP